MKPTKLTALAPARSSAPTSGSFAIRLLRDGRNGLGGSITRVSMPAERKRGTIALS